MPEFRNILVTLIGVTPVMASETPAPEASVPAKPAQQQVGVLLSYRPHRARLGAAETIEDFADLSLGEKTVPTVSGIGKILRILRIGRLATPSDPAVFLGHPELACEALRRAIGVRFRAKLRPRSRIRFVAWTDSGMEVVEDVAEVFETQDEYFITRQKGRFPLRIPRKNVVRQKTEVENWWEVLNIQRL